MTSAFTTLEEVVSADAFPDVDMALRRGRHVDRDDGERYVFLIDAQALLEAFYRRYGCELVHKSDGYFYLLPVGDRLSRRHLSPGEMLVGQALALLYLDPATVERRGRVTREQVLGQLAGTIGTESLVRAMNPKRRRYDERVAEETVRSKVAEAMRRLAALGFIEIGEADETGADVRLRPALTRFADPVRDTAAPEAALERLVQAGELILTDTDGEDRDEADDDTSQDAEPLP